VMISVEGRAKETQRGSSDDSSTGSSEGDPREGQVMQTPVESRVKETPERVT
jgi:hypothetical protein